MRVGRVRLTFLVVGLTCAACGKKGAPLPPLVRMPAAVGEPVAMRVDNDVFVRFAVPAANADTRTPADIARVEVYAVTALRPPRAEDDLPKLRRVSTLIATEQVRRSTPPPPPPREGTPPPPPTPLPPGVDQGATIVIHETLTPEARTPVELPTREGQRALEAATELPGPLVASLESHDPIRYYYAVGVSPSGRYGLVQQFLPVPLGETSSAPGAPRVTYDEKNITLQWNAPANARGTAEGPLVPDALPAKPIVPGPPTTTYDVYEVPRNASANATPALPVALTPEPVGALEFTTPLATFGVERCFAVRPVDIISGYHVRGPASPMVCITPKDTFPPAPPRSLAAVSSGGAVNLIWEPSESSDVTGYLLLRGEAPGATLSPLFADPITETTFVDRTVRAGVTYIYAVVAVDKASNRSEESNRVEETARQ